MIDNDTSRVAGIRNGIAMAYKPKWCRSAIMTQSSSGIDPVYNRKLERFKKDYSDKCRSFAARKQDKIDEGMSSYDAEQAVAQDIDRDLFFANWIEDGADRKKEVYSILVGAFGGNS